MSQIFHEMYIYYLLFTLNSVLIGHAVYLFSKLCAPTLLSCTIQYGTISLVLYHTMSHKCYPGCRLLKARNRVQFLCVTTTSTSPFLMLHTSVLNATERAGLGSSFILSFLPSVNKYPLNTYQLPSTEVYSADTTLNKIQLLSSRSSQLIQADRHVRKPFQSVR